VRAVLLAAGGETELAEPPLPPPREGEVAVEVETVALGPLDLLPATDTAVVPGRGVAGRLAAPLAALGLAAGARVAVDPRVPCGECGACRRLEPAACRRPGLAGTPAHPGGLAGRLTVVPTRLRPLPADVDSELGALLHLLALAVAALETAAPAPAEGVAVFGLGPLGLLVLQLARLAGCRPVFGVDPLAERTEAALAAGADLAAVDPAVLREAGGGGLPVVVASAEAGEMVLAAGEILAPDGRLVAVGPGLPPLVLDGERPASAHRLPHPRSRHWRRALALLADGRLDPTAVVTHRTTLEAAPSLLRRLAREPGAVLCALVHLRR